MSNTIAFSNKNSSWKSTYSYSTTCFASVNKEFVTFSQPVGESPNICWKHTKDSKFNKFYNDDPVNSHLAVTFNDNPSQNKIFKSLSIEGGRVADNSINFFRANADIGDRKISYGGNLKEKGGILYGHIGQSQGNSQSNVATIGYLESVNFYGTIMEAVLSNPNYSIVSNDTLIFFYNLSDEGFYNTSSTLQDIVDTPYAELENDPGAFTLNVDIFYDNGGLSFNWTETGQTSLINFQSDQNPYLLIGVSPSNIQGDQLRGQFSESWFILPPGDNGFEINAFNLNYEPTDLDHSK